MTIGFNTLFSQRDVRITPTSTATATAVGLTEPLYVTLATYADLVNERVLTAGDGIDFTDNGAGGTLVIAGELASTANKGIASFDATDFDVAAGVVTIDDANTVRTVVAGEGIDVTSASGNPTISGEDATSANKGIASFNADFTVTAGNVALANKTSYWTCSGMNFHPKEESSEYWYADSYGHGIGYSWVNGQTSAMASVELPHGAVVTGIIVWGGISSGAITGWYLYRLDSNGANSVTMATAATFDSEDTSITSGTIDNSAYTYHIEVNVSGGNEPTILGARITYTTDYD